jgi:hypothetical protein
VFAAHCCLVVATFLLAFGCFDFFFLFGMWEFLMLHKMACGLGSVLGFELFFYA